MTAIPHQSVLHSRHPLFHTSSSLKYMRTVFPTSVSICKSSPLLPPMYLPRIMVMVAPWYRGQIRSVSFYHIITAFSLLAVTRVTSPLPVPPPPPMFVSYSSRLLIPHPSSCVSSCFLIPCSSCQSSLSRPPICTGPSPTRTPDPTIRISRGILSTSSCLESP